MYKWPTSVHHPQYQINFLQYFLHLALFQRGVDAENTRENSEQISGYIQKAIGL